MGASDSKLVFKQGIQRLVSERSISATDPYWTSFWSLPESAEDVFSLFSSKDIRKARDSSLANTETLLLAITSRLFYLRNHRAFPDPEIAPERELLNCIRVLTRLLPFLYEAELEAWRNKFFWGQRRRKVHKASKQDVIFDERGEDEVEKQQEPEEDQFEDYKPLAEELIDTLIDLLFTANFTLPVSRSSKSKVTYEIWQTGVGCNSAPGSTKEFESNRVEVLRLLLTLAGYAMYMPANTLPTAGVQTISYIVTCPDKQVVLSVLCSLLNTTMNFNPATWRMPYDHVVFKDSHHILVTYSLQLLLVLLLYPLPETYSSDSKNYYRHYFGRLHRPRDFQFLSEGILRILNQPIQANSTYLPGSRKPIKSAPETIMLFWEALQCNKRFRAFILTNNRSLEFLVPIIFYASEYRTDPSKLGVVRMCVFILQTLSTESAFSISLNRIFEGQDSLPVSSRIQGFNGTYADYLVISIFTLMTSSNGQLNSVYPALLAIINNIAAYAENLASSSTSKIIQLFTSMSSPSFLFANDTNHDLLHSLLEAINAFVEHQYSKNPNLIYAILRSKRKFESLRNFTLESGQQEIERQKSRQKDQQTDPGLGSLSRAGSIDSVRSPVAASARTPTLSNVPENSDAFAIGDDEDSDEEREGRRTPAHSSPSPRASRTPSVSSTADDAVPLQLRGMSEKARGKLPAGGPSFSRQGSSTNMSMALTSGALGGNFTPSATWIESWLPLLPLHTILTLLSELSPRFGASSTPSTVRDLVRNVAIGGIDPSPIRVHLFEWSTLSLGWYESLLWGLIFTSEMDISVRGTVGVWNGTAIKLFRVQESTREGPSLMQPRGMVDAVGSSLVNRVTSLNLRGPNTETASSGGAGQTASNP